MRILNLILFYLFKLYIIWHELCLKRDKNISEEMDYIGDCFLGESLHYAAKAWIKETITHSTDHFLVMSKYRHSKLINKLMYDILDVFFINNANLQMQYSIPCLPIKLRCRGYVKIHLESFFLFLFLEKSIQKLLENRCRKHQPSVI